MVRFYKRKREKSWSLNTMIIAVEEYKRGNTSCAAIAKHYGIPNATLRRYIQIDRDNDEYPVHGGRFRETFSENQLCELSRYISDIERRAFGLTRIQLKKLVYDFAEENRIPHRFNKELKLAGYEWLQTFIHKYGFHFKTPKSSEHSCLMGFNKIDADLFFSTLNEIRMKNNYTGHQIYNADEFALLLIVPSVHPESNSSNTKLESYYALSSKQDQNVTVVCGMNPSGAYIPPFFIYPDLTDFKNESPQYKNEETHESGWTKKENFLLYLEHFAKFAKPSCDNPILLLIDNQMMHTSLEVIKFCKTHFITLLGFPPHSTLNLQPVDVSLFGPLRVHYTEACSDFVASHVGHVITKDHICNLFKKAYSKVATSRTASKGFKACGIEPFNSHIFPKEIFKTSIKTETPEEIFATPIKTETELEVFETSVKTEIKSEMYSTCDENSSDYFYVTP